MASNVTPLTKLQQCQSQKRACEMSCLCARINLVTWDEIIYDHTVVKSIVIFSIALVKIYHGTITGLIIINKYIK